MVGFCGTRCITWGLAALRYGGGEDFYCRHEEKHSQRQLKESRARRESSALNMASRLNRERREGRRERERKKREGRGEGQERGVKGPRLYRMEELGEGKPMHW